MKIGKISQRFDEAAAKYDEQRRFFIPCFDDYYGASVSFLAKCKSSFNSILDLGAGTGLLTQYLYNEYPDAHYTLIDVSEQMLEIAKKRFGNLHDMEYIVSDYSTRLPEKSFDLIASALSIHHLENSAKSQLYTRIFNKLNAGGYLINLDQFIASSDKINEYYNRWWYDYIERNNISENERKAWLQRRELDRENTIEETITILKQIGFKSVECIYSFMKFGVILAIK